MTNTVSVQIRIYNARESQEISYDKIIKLMPSLPEFLQLKDTPKFVESRDVCTVISLTRFFKTPIRHASVILGNRRLQKYDDIINIEMYSSKIPQSPNWGNCFQTIAEILNPGEISLARPDITALAEKYMSQIGQNVVNGPRPIGIIGYMAFENLRLDNIENRNALLARLQNAGSKTKIVGNGFLYLNSNDQLDIAIYDRNYLELANACGGYLRWRT